MAEDVIVKDRSTLCGRFALLLCWQFSHLSDSILTGCCWKPVSHFHSHFHLSSVFSFLERVRAQRRSFQLYSALKNLISLNIFGGNLCNDSCWASQ